MNLIQAIRTLFAVALLLTTLFGLASPAMAHEADCPFCKLKLVQNTETMDNEVVVRFGNKRIEYRCVYCVFADQKRFTGDLVVYAPSEKAGAPVILKRTGGQWSAPEGTVFLNAFKRHKTCAAESRAFSSKEAFDRYVAANKVESPRALTLTQLLEEIAKPKRKG